MLETIPLLKTINERLPGADISLASSVENVVVSEAMTLATQTTDSLEDLSSTAVQTDQDMDNKIHESGIDVAVDHQDIIQDQSESPSLLKMLELQLKQIGLNFGHYLGFSSDC
jgi:predicted amino acid-binding ACT domain protein